MNNTTAPLLKKISEYGQLMLSAGLDAGSDFADRHRDGTRKESEAGELLASITADITKQQAADGGEILWQYRLRPEWSEAWSAWEMCTAEAAADYVRVPAGTSWLYEVRKFQLVAEVVESKSPETEVGAFASATQSSAPPEADYWMIVKEAAVYTGDADGLPSLGWEVLRDSPVFTSFEETCAAIEKLKLPLGWVALECRRLVPECIWRTPPAAPQIEVWFGSMPESNGRENWTVTLRRKERPGNTSPSALHRLMSGVSVYRSEFKDRARYEADRLRFLLGAIDKEPRILDYDADLHSGYTEPAAATRPLQLPTQSEQSDADEVGVWCRYVAGMVVAYLGGPVDDVRIKPIAGIIQRRLHHLAAYGLPSTDKLVHELASCRDAMPRFPETDNEFVESIGDALSVAAYVRATIAHIRPEK